MRLRILYLKARSRIVPWCMRPGCWERSETRFSKDERGNLCAVHLWQSIREWCDVDPTPEG